VSSTVEAGGALEATGTLEADVAGGWCVRGPARHGGGFQARWTRPRPWSSEGKC
jgi:hypothetical protein